MDRFVRSFLLMALVLAGAASCSRKVAPPVSSAPPPPQFQTLADIPEADQAGIAALGKKIEEALRAGDDKVIVAAFDRAGIIDAICADLQLPERALSEFKGGMSKGLGGSIDQVARIWAKQEAKFKGAAVYRGSPAARFRFSGDDTGITIVDLVVRARGGGQWGITNFYNHVADIDLVEQVKQTAAPMVARMDKTLLERLLSKSDLKVADYDKFGSLSQKLMAGDFAGVIFTYQGLPVSLREGRLATALYLNALQNAGDDETYKKEIKAAAARFNSANYDFMLVDVYYLDKEYGKAVECLDRFMSRVEKDAVILSLKALLQLQTGETADAAKTVHEALALEPETTSVHVKGLDVLLAARDFTALRDSMIYLEEKARMNFKDGMGDAMWADFLKAPESERWR